MRVKIDINRVNLDIDRFKRLVSSSRIQEMLKHNLFIGEYSSKPISTITIWSPDISSRLTINPLNAAFIVHSFEYESYDVYANIEPYGPMSSLLSDNTRFVPRVIDDEFIWLNRYMTEESKLITIDAEENKEWFVDKETLDLGTFYLLDTGGNE